MNRLKTKYLEEARNKLKEDFNYRSDLAVPRVMKVVINTGVADAKDNEGVLEKVKVNMTAITGQKPVVTKARKSISNFKLTKGNPIGLMVTLRGERMFVFLDKLINVVLPKVRDFRGVSDRSFDGQGNFNLGLREFSIFPEVDYRNIDRPRGLQITIATSARNREEGKKLLSLLGMPFAG